MFLKFKVLIFLEFLMGSGILLTRHSLRPAHRRLISAPMIFVLLATPVYGLFGRYVVLFDLMLLLFTWLFGRSRAATAGLFLALLPTVPALNSQTTIGSAAFLVLNSFIPLAVGGCLGLARTSGRSRAPAAQFDLAAAGLVVLFTIMDARGMPFTSILRYLTYEACLIGAPYYLLSRAGNTPEQMEQALVGFCCGGVAVSFVGIFEGLKSWALFEHYYVNFGLPLLSQTMLNIRAGHMRAPGSALDPTVFGFILVVVLCAMGPVRRYFSPKGYVACVGALLLALLLTQARGDWLGGVVAWLAMGLYRGKIARAAMAAVATIAGQVAVPLLGENSTIGQSLGSSGGAADTADYRKLVFQKGMEQVRAHPWTGQSSDTLAPILRASLEQGEHIVDLVNTHLVVALEAGVPGFLWWAAAWLGTIAALVSLRRRLKRTGYGDIARAALGMMTASVVVLAFTSPIDRNVVLPTIAMAITAAAVRGSRGNARVPRPAPAVAEPALQMVPA